MVTTPVGGRVGRVAQDWVTGEGGLEPEGCGGWGCPSVGGVEPGAGVLTIAVRERTPKKNSQNQLY